VGVANIMFRIKSCGGISNTYKVDKDAQFQPGQIAQLRDNGSETAICSVCTGTRPCGIIDDVKMLHMEDIVKNEVVIGIPNQPKGLSKLSSNLCVELNHPNIIERSYVSTQTNVELLPGLGIMTFVTGTPLNFSSKNDGVLDAIKAKVSYRYKLRNVPGDDTTISSGKVTVWDVPGMIFESNQVDLNAPYHIGMQVFVGSDGRLTTRNYFNTDPVAEVALEPNPADFENLGYWFVTFKWFGVYTSLCKTI
jgi:hypothetical protein